MTFTRPAVDGVAGVVPGRSPTIIWRDPIPVPQSSPRDREHLLEFVLIYSARKVGKPPSLMAGIPVARVLADDRTALLRREASVPHLFEQFS